MTEKMKATALDAKQILKNGIEMDETQRTTGMTRTGTFLIASLCAAMLTLVCGLHLIAPGTAQAKVTNASTNTCSVSSCHPTGVALQVPPAIEVAVQNVTQAGPSTIYSGPITVDPNDVLEIDWKFTGLEYAAGATSPNIWVPSGWTLAAGTNNSPPITLGTNNWSTAWDAATGETWNLGPRATDDTNAPDGWMIDYTTSAAGWGNASGVASNDGSAGDLDTWAGEMGADARITIPNTPGATYYVWVYGSGKGQEPGKTKNVKASVGQMLTINVTGAANTTPTLTINQPDGTGDSVTEGSSFNINYDLADAEQTVTVAFYYDTNNTGLDGVAAANCAVAPEGTGVNCAWDTTGVTPGDYFIYGITDDGIAPQVSAYSSGVVTVNAANTAPTLTINQPDGTGDSVTEGSSFNINYDLADAEQTVTVSFYYDTNNSGLDGVAAANCAAAPEGTGVDCAWDTTGVTPGDYFIYGISDDGIAPQVSAYSSGTVTVNAANTPPTLTINQPDGAGDSVTEGSSFNINYDLADAEQTVTVAFYYDTNNSGLDGTAAANCAAAPEGAGVDCAWDTTGVTPGNYYIYGITDDGIAAQVSAYSSGTVTVNPAGGPDSLGVTSNTTLATSAVEGNTAVLMQRLQVDCTAGGGDDGICEITGITVDDLGSVTGTEIDFLRIYIDTDTSFAGTEPNVADATFAGTSQAIDLTSIATGDRQVTAGTPKYIWVAYDLAAGSAPQTVQTSVTAVAVNTGSGDTGAAGTWNSNSFAITAAGGPDSLSVTSNTILANFATEGDTDVQMQRLDVSCTAGGGDDGICEITGITVDDLGSVTGTQIDSLNIYVDTDTSFAGTEPKIADVTFAGTSQAISLTSLPTVDRQVTAGTPKYIWVTYDLAAGSAPATVQTSVTAVAVNTGSGDTGAAGTWNSNSFAISAVGSGLSCSDCHDYPPLDGTRDGSTGAVVGDHQTPAHLAATCDYCHVVPVTAGHRNGDIEMKDGTIGDAGSGDNGSYSRGATFAQSNSPTTGTCSNVDCHNNAVTPQWGIGIIDHVARSYVTGGATTCMNCHDLGAAANWTVETLHLNDCNLCHTTMPALQGGLAAGVCTVCHTDTWTTLHATTPPDHSNLVTTTGSNCTSCHEDQLVGATATTHLEDCSNCHNADGSLVTTLGTDTQTFAGGGNCETCHGSTWGSIHTVAPDHSSLVQVAATDCASCHDNTLASAATDTHLADCSNCHSAIDGSLVTTLGTDTQTFATGGDCTTCHGSNNWGTVHATAPDHSALVTTTGTNNCASCHEDTLVGATATTHLENCTNCHNTSTGALTTTLGTDTQTFAGGGNCETCHTSGWGTTHTPVTPSHNLLITVAGTTAGWTNCGSCHSDPPPLTDNADAKVHNACGTCHNANGSLVATLGTNNQDFGTGGNCETCHGTVDTSVTFSSTHTTHAASHTVSVGSDQSNGQSCDNCHDVTNWTLIEGTEHNVATNGAGSCATCHNSPTPAVVSVISAGGSVTCLDCHSDKTAAHGSVDHVALTYVTLGGTGLYYDRVTEYEDCATAGDCKQCVDCHDPGGAANATVDVIHGGDCSLCHTTVPALKAGVPAGGGDCVTCHTGGIHTLWTRYMDTCSRQNGGAYGQPGIACHPGFNNGPGNSLHDAHNPVGGWSDWNSATSGMIYPFSTNPEMWTTDTMTLTPTCQTCHTDPADSSSGPGCGECHAIRAKGNLHTPHAAKQQLDIACDNCHWN